jgi:hypothetical protein
MRCWGIAAMVCAVMCGRAAAETCPVPPGASASLAQIDSAERYAFVAGTLEAERRKGRIWNHAWGWGLLGAGIAQTGLGLYAADKEDAGEESFFDCPECEYVGAAKAYLGVAATFVLNPVRVETVARTSTPGCEDVARAEDRLRAAAKSERVTWIRHAEGVVINAAGVLYLGLEHDEWKQGLIGAAIGLTVGQIRLWTRPDGAVSAQRDYEDGRIGVREGNGLTAWAIVPTVGVDSHGLSLVGAF